MSKPYQIKSLSVTPYFTDETIIGEIAELTIDAVEAFFANLSDTPRWKNKSVIDFELDADHDAADMVIGNAYQIDALLIERAE